MDIGTGVALFAIVDSAWCGSGLVAKHSFTQVHTPERTWQAPTVFVFGKKPL
ncbi:MAG: hypothetical protein IPK60_03555 [Sandaracinaceae bacterium]|nr:hypothetical protein [Sandaracinaceae bacterium]